MPTGGCFCGQVKIEYSGEPAMTVRLSVLVLVCLLLTLSRPCVIAPTAVRSLEACTATTYVHRARHGVPLHGAEATELTRGPI
jgi:hypothetical protein